MTPRGRGAGLELYGTIVGSMRWQASHDSPKGLGLEPPLIEEPKPGSGPSEDTLLSRQGSNPGSRAPSNPVPDWRPGIVPV